MGDEHGPADPGGLVLVLGPQTDRDAVAALCARLEGLRPGPATLVVCDASAIVEATLSTVEALARLRLATRRLGVDLRVRGMRPALRHLLALTGLNDIVLGDGAPPLEPAPVEPASAPELGSARELASALELKRQTEQREEPLHVEEVRDAADPAG